MSDTKRWFTIVGLPMLATISVGILTSVVMKKGDFCELLALWCANIPQLVLFVVSSTAFLSIIWACMECDESKKERIIEWLIVAAWAIISLDIVLYLAIKLFL